MSLAIYAAPFNNENDDYKNNDNMIYKKKQTHNKTQKKYDRENFDTEKVNSVLQSIHQNSKVEEDGDTLGEFNPPPKPESAGVQKTVTTEQMMNMTNQNLIKTLGKSPEPHYEYNPENDLELNLITPESNSSNSVRHLSNVDFPEPLSPTKETISLAFNENETPFNALIPFFLR